MDEVGVEGVRKDEYKETIITWRHLQNVRYVILGTAITGFVGLIGAFQLAFPRDVPTIEFSSLGANNPRLYIVNLIPFAGMILSAASILGLFEWHTERAKVFLFGTWLERELRLISEESQKGFFTSATLGQSLLFTSGSAFIVILLVVSIGAWNGVRKEVEAYKAQLPRSVVTEPQKGTAPLLKVPSQVEPKEKSK